MGYFRKPYQIFLSVLILCFSSIAVAFGEEAKKGNQENPQQIVKKEQCSCSNHSGAVGERGLGVVLQATVLCSRFFCA